MTLAASGSLAACGSDASPAKGGNRNEVLIRTSGGSFEDALKKFTWEPFTKETGIKVTPVPANEAKIAAMVQAGNGGVDLIIGTDLLLTKLSRASALEQLDKSKFTRTDISKLTRFEADKCDYCIFAETIVYNTKTFASKAPKTWADVWDAKAFPGKRALQDASAITPDLEMALLADGVARDKLYPLDIDRAFASLARIKPHVLKFYTTGALGAQMMISEQAVIGALWNTRTQLGIDSGAPLAMVWNDAKRISNGMAIVKNSPNLENAYKLMDYSLQAKNQGESFGPLNLSPANVDGLQHMDPKFAELLPTSPKYIDLSFQEDSGWWLDNQDEVNRRWQEFLVS